jgi:hypothetical protein
MSLRNELRKLKTKVFSFFDLSSFNNPVTPKISVNLITYNNIKTIQSCIESVLALEDLSEEIIVVDSGSTDGTLEYLKSIKKIEIIEKNFFAGYSQHRNIALKASRASWILVLDSDEYLDKAFYALVPSLLKSKLYSGYRFYRRWLIQKNAYINLFDYKGQFTSSLRLFRNLPKLEYRGELHESLFGLEEKRIKKLPKKQAFIYHLDLLSNPLEARLEKVLSREKQLKGAGHPEEYLPELFNLPISLL